MEHVKIALLLWIVFSACAFAWKEHGLITELSIQRIVDANARVTYESLGSALARRPSEVPSESQERFVAWLQIHKGYPFENKLGELPGSLLSQNSVLSTYSDEPDWGIDAGLYAPDQYPWLTSKDQDYVPGPEETLSENLRHQYFSGKWNWREPLASWQIPDHPIGEAVERAAFFFDLALRFFRVGSFYWGNRFLAWSLHYVEDLYCPFRVRQSPAYSLVVFRWKGLFPSIDLPESREQIGYYRLSYEEWVNDLVRTPNSLLARRLSQMGSLSSLMKSIDAYLKEDVVSFSSAYARSIAKNSLEVFPKFGVHTEQKASELVGSPPWRTNLQQGEAAAKLRDRTILLFARMSHSVQTVTHFVQQAVPTKNPK